MLIDSNYISNNNNIEDSNDRIMRQLLKITLIINAVVYGWNIRTNADNKLILSKKLEKLQESDYDTVSLLCKLFNLIDD